MASRLRRRRNLMRSGGLRAAVSVSPTTAPSPLAPIFHCPAQDRPMLRTLRAGIAPAALTLLAGCLKVGPDANSTTLDFDMGAAGQVAGWEVGGADFPVNREADVGLIGEVRTLPSPLTTTQTALYQSGTNDSGDGLSGCPSSGTFALRTTGRQQQSLGINTDVDGAFWLFVGTQSTALARHEIYITHIRVTLYLAN